MRTLKRERQIKTKGILLTKRGHNLKVQQSKTKRNIVEWGEKSKKIEFEDRKIKKGIKAR